MDLERRLRETITKELKIEDISNIVLSYLPPLPDLKLYESLFKLRNLILMIPESPGLIKKKHKLLGWVQYIIDDMFQRNCKKENIDSVRGIYMFELFNPHNYNLKIHSFKEFEDCVKQIYNSILSIIPIKLTQKPGWTSVWDVEKVQYEGFTRFRAVGDVKIGVGLPSSYPRICIDFFENKEINPSDDIYIPLPQVRIFIERAIYDDNNQSYNRDLKIFLKTEYIRQCCLGDKNVLGGIKQVIHYNDSKISTPPLRSLGNIQAPLEQRIKFEEQVDIKIDIYSSIRKVKTIIENWWKVNTIKGEYNNNNNKIINMYKRLMFISRYIDPYGLEIYRREECKDIIEGLDNYLKDIYNYIIIKDESSYNYRSVCKEVVKYWDGNHMRIKFSTKPTPSMGINQYNYYKKGDCLRLRNDDNTYSADTRDYLRKYAKGQIKDIHSRMFNLLNYPRNLSNLL